MNFKRHHTSDYLFLTLYSFFTLILFFLSFFYLYVENNKIIDRLVNSATPHVELHYSQIYQNSILNLR